MLLTEYKGLFKELILRFVKSREQREQEKEALLKKEAFLKDLNETKEALSEARNNYNYIQEPALLEYYIYEIKALETRLDFYVSRAKREGMRNEDVLGGTRQAFFKRGEAF